MSGTRMQTADFLFGGLAIRKSGQRHRAARPMRMTVHLPATGAEGTEANTELPDIKTTHSFALGPPWLGPLTIQCFG
jgi:hypothetical protein